ncbi:MAG: hypothetical protein P4L81_01840 [Candidatus Pacebacteria bacterium]|nr:hypothetical protein [Candidatus Paceibacterota bacterium]
MSEFAHGINPGLPLPGDPKDAKVEIEGIGELNFDDPQESVGSLVSQVLAMNTGRSRIGNFDFFTVTAWDAGRHHLKVKLNDAETA